MLNKSNKTDENTIYDRHPHRTVGGYYAICGGEDGEYVGKGNYVLLHFWSTWAGSARKELKTIKDIVRKYKDKPLTVIGISLNKNGTDWKNYVSARGLKWTHLSNIKEFDSPAARAYGVVSMPMTVLIAPDGTIVSQGIQHERLPETLRQLIP